MYDSSFCRLKSTSSKVQQLRTQTDQVADINELEPLDFRQESNIDSSLLLHMLLDSTNEHAISGRKESHIHQPIVKQSRQQPELLLYQRKKQKLSTDGTIRFKDLFDKNCDSSVNHAQQNQRQPSQGRHSDHIKCCSHFRGVRSICQVNKSTTSTSFSKAALPETFKRKAAGIRTNGSANNNNKFKYIKVVGGGYQKSSDSGLINSKLRVPLNSEKHFEMNSLHDCFNSILESRGYVTSKCSASELGYIKSPSPLQLASFSSAVCSATNAGDANRLKSMLQCGLSALPMNKFGDSPFFRACKRGVTEIVQTFIECGADVKVADCQGRSPLHHATWANPPNFEIVKLILAADPRLLYVTDQHGKTPLDFVTTTYFGDWMKFFDSVAASLWPANAAREYHPESSKGPVPDPPNEISLQLAEGVASGKIKPKQVKEMIRRELPASVLSPIPIG